MILHRIQHRIIFFFVPLVIVILFISGWTLQWTVRRSLENELGNKLTAVAGAAAVQYDNDEIGFMLQNIGPRTLVRLRQRLVRLAESSDIKRISLFNLDGQSLLDTEDSIRPGTPYFNLRFYKSEIDEIGQGRTAHTILFEDLDGNPTMSGYAPLRVGSEIVGGVRVHGSVTFLESVNRLRTQLIILGSICTIAAVFIGILLARTITRPVERLVAASERIARGILDTPIPVTSHGEIGILAHTMEDMRRNILERERELKAMLAGVAHEIRNPLGGIELFTGLLTDEVKGKDEARAHVDRIAGEVRHLKEIVESFLDYARPRKPVPEHCNIHDSLTETIELLHPELSEHKIKIEISDDNTNHTWTDPHHLKRIFLNLLQNAIRAMPDGGQITCTWMLDNEVILKIIDSGTGIPEVAQKQIFNPFFTTREKGTGLGLSIVKGLVEANGGSIRLIRSDKNGTKFEVRLPKERNP